MSKIKTLVLLIFLLRGAVNATPAGTPVSACSLFYTSLSKTNEPPAQERMPLSPRRLIRPLNAPLPGNFLWGHTYWHYQPTGATLNSLKTRLVSQEKSLECPIFATLGAIESAMANRGTPMELSAPFLVGHKLLAFITEQVLQTRNPFVSSLNEFHFLKGGQQYNIIHLIKQVGMMPDHIWVPRKPLNEWKMDIIYSQINREVFEAISDFKSKTFYTKEEGVYWKIERINEIFKRVLGDYVGHWPFPFTYNDRQDLTPLTFSEHNGLNLKEVPEMIYTNSVPYPMDDQANTMNLVFRKDNFPNSKKPFLHSPISQNEFYRKIKKALQNHKAVVLDVQGEFVGVGHSLAVTDVEVRFGKVVAVQLKNSESLWLGDGYVWFSVEELNKHIHRAWIFDLH